MPYLTETPDHRALVLDSIEMLMDACYQNSLQHGFWNDYLTTRDFLSDYHQQAMYTAFETATVLAKLALIHSEVGEATEAARKPGNDEHCPDFSKLEIELADVLIRVFDFAGAYALDLGSAVLAKMEYNRSRDPMHGKLA